MDLKAAAATGRLSHSIQVLKPGHLFSFQAIHPSSSGTLNENSPQVRPQGTPLVHPTMQRAARLSQSQDSLELENPDPFLWQAYTPWENNLSSHTWMKRRKDMEPGPPTSLQILIILRMLFFCPLPFCPFSPFLSALHPTPPLPSQVSWAPLLHPMCSSMDFAQFCTLIVAFPHI